MILCHGRVLALGLASRIQHIAPLLAAIRSNSRYVLWSLRNTEYRSQRSDEICSTIMNLAVSHGHAKSSCEIMLVGKCGSLYQFIQSMKRECSGYDRRASGLSWSPARAVGGG